MDPNNNDKELQEKLSEGPTSEPGFSDHLRTRIEAKIREEARKSRRKSLFLLKIAAVLVIVAFMADYQSVGELLQSKPTALMETAKDNAMANWQPAPQPQIRDAVLLGLRRDHSPDGSKQAESVTYRTLLIAPVNGNLQVAAQGSGILLPYKSEFWKIASKTHDSGNGLVRYLAAYPADERENTEPGEQPRNESSQNAPVLYDESLTFVGNKYVSLEISVPAELKPISYRINTVLQLRGGGPAAIPERLLNKPAPYVSLSGMLAIHEAVSDSDWAIVRSTGKWTAIAAKANGGEPPADTERYQKISANLLESIVSHDELAVDWTTVTQLQPKARDALSSPDRDLLAIVMNKEIQFYEIGRSADAAVSGTAQIDAKPLLTIALQENERLIMAQWATGSYVPKWIEKTREYLGGS